MIFFSYTIHWAPTLTSLANQVQAHQQFTSGISPDRILAWNIDKDLISSVST
jgi:hypothetical protein